MKPIEFPVMNVRMLPLDKLEANDYNPNRMAAPELKLLKISIEEDGFTQPIVAYYNAERDVYEIVDGFHRYLCARDYFHLDEVPVTVIDKPIEERIASTIRHNRARGTHQIVELDEVIRLKQISGLRDAFAGHVFSHSWEEFERRLEEEEQERETGSEPGEEQP